MTNTSPSSRACWLREADSAHSPASIVSVRPVDVFALAQRQVSASNHSMYGTWRERCVLVCLSHLDECEPSAWTIRSSRLFIRFSLSSEQGKHPILFASSFPRSTRPSIKSSLAVQRQQYQQDFTFFCAA